MLKIEQNSKNKMMTIIKNIFPLARRFNSPGMDKAYEIIKDAYDELQIYEYPSGLVCEDWVVPFSWEATSGILKDEKGNVLVSLEDEILFVSAYSEPIEGWFSKKEIIEHALVHPKLKDVFMFQHRLGFNLEAPQWGISLSQNIVDQLDESKKYYIKIEVEKKENSMKVAEWVLKGESSKTICIAAHIDEQLCNDDLTGCVVGLELMQSLQKLPKRKYTYQLLIFPETIGSFVHMYNNLEDFDNTLCQLNLEMVGAGEQLKIKHSLNGNTCFDHILEMALKHQGIDYGHLDFFDGYGNDERSFEWPTFKIPGVALQRHPFKYYHTSKDTPEIIKPEYLWQALEVSKTFIEILEKDYIPMYTMTLPPKLSKRGLYFDAVNDRENFKKFNNNLLYMINGKTRLSEIVQQLDIDFFEVYYYLEQFIGQNLITKRDF